MSILNDVYLLIGTKYQLNKAHNIREIRFRYLKYRKIKKNRLYEAEEICGARVSKIASLR